MALFLLNNALSSQKSRVFSTSSKLLFGNYDTCHNYEDVILDTCLSPDKVGRLAIWQISYVYLYIPCKKWFTWVKITFYYSKKCCFIWISALLSGKGGECPGTAPGAPGWPSFTAPNFGFSEHGPRLPRKPPRNGGGILGIFLGGKTGIHKNPYILVCYLVLRVFWGNFGDAFLNFGEFWGCRLFSQKIIIFRIVTYFFGYFGDIGDVFP